MSPSLGLFGDSPWAPWLLVVVMLLMLLLSRVHRRERGLDRPRTRQSPITPEELARTVFELGRSNDWVGYRNIFLSGGEARIVLGDKAPAYMEARSNEALRRALTSLHSRIPRTAVYGGVESSLDNRCSMWIRLEDGTRATIFFGLAVQVGRVWRLVDAPADRRPQEISEEECRIEPLAL